MQSPIDITEELVSAMCLERPETGHKGTFGRLLIYAGSTGMGGAAIMATESALCSGVGLVYVLAPENILTPLMTRCPEALGIMISNDQIEPHRPSATPLVARFGPVNNDWFAPLLADKDAVLMGPGLATERLDVKANLPIAIREVKHLVLDAGALAVLAASDEWKNWLAERRDAGLAPLVMTPHQGEFQRLFPGWEMGDLASAGAFAEEYGVMLVLKSNETNIFTPSGKWYSNRVSNSGLAKGGSGDVLAGLLAGLLATGMNEEAAAVSAVKIHSLAGEYARVEYGARAMLPTMLKEYYAACFDKLNWEKGSEN